MQKLSIKNREKFIFGLLLTFLLIFPVAQINAQSSVQKNQLKFGRLLRLIDGYYVDTININALTEKAVVKVLSELDPHSTYISKDEVKKMNEPLKGNFEGIGISFNIFKDTLLVTSTISGGPSEKVGLRGGDRIVDVDGKNIAGIGLKNSDVFDLLRGDKGTRVDLKVLRKGVEELLDFTIIRDKIPIFSIDASFMLNKSTGYIKLNKFAATSTEEFLAAIKKLEKENVKNLVFDLRGNTGGYLKTAIEISDQFLGDRSLVVYTEGTNDLKREYKASARGTFEKGNLVILINESSASASEIVSGAIQDWDRGVIIGRRSFGKGLVQKPFLLTDGSMVRLTTAHYYTPSGRCIQKSYKKGVKEYRKDYIHRMENGEMFSADSIKFDESQKCKTLVNGRTVFGGGGIMPDIFIPMDTSAHYRYINKLRRKSVIYNYALDYIDSNRKELLNKYPEFNKFNKNFEVTDKMVSEIVEKGVKEKVEKDDESLIFSRNDMKKEIKAIIARDLFSRNDFYKILLEDDKVILKAIEVIENKKSYNSYLVKTE
jgi:carboxyl-terminal processing protease